MDTHVSQPVLTLNVLCPLLCVKPDPNNLISADLSIKNVKESSGPISKVLLIETLKREWKTFKSYKIR
jgi:hypothetical protein